MSGYVDNHPLSRDLPEYRNDIHQLKMTDNHFHKRMIAYETLDKEIVRAEQGLENMPDQELEGMKVRRVRMKDELTEMLRKANAKI